jgi:hypothetical protein
MENNIYWVPEALYLHLFRVRGKSSVVNRQDLLTMVIFDQNPKEERGKSPESTYEKW